MKTKIDLIFKYKWDTLKYIAERDLNLLYYYVISQGKIKVKDQKHEQEIRSLIFESLKRRKYESK